jgi:predicted acyltransferase
MAPQAAPAAFPSQRLHSLDALRGFDMFWIMGAEELFHTLAKATGSPFWGTIANQFTHPDWNGFHFYDLIFPLFLFIAGVATPYSVGRDLEKRIPRSRLLARVVRRGLILIVLGIIYNNGLELRPLSQIRFPSVLGRIGTAYMIANIIYLYTAPKRRELFMGIWFVGLLIGYLLLMALNSAPGFPCGDLSMQGNFASYVDRMILPGKLYLGIHDPEGLFSTIPAIATGLLGILAGSYLRKALQPDGRRAARLAGTGALFIGLALAWNPFFPINKNLWTSSFVLTTGGLSLILLALFYYVIDVRGVKRWAFFFRVIGMNSILIYMSGHFIDWDYANTGFFQWLGQWVGNPYNAFVMAICYIGLKWLFLYFLYRKKVFLRV